MHATCIIHIHVHMYMYACTCILLCNFRGLLTLRISLHCDERQYENNSILTYIFLSHLFSLHTHIQEQLSLVAAATQSSQNMRRRGNPPTGGEPGAGQHDRGPISIVASESLMNSPQLQIMTPLLHFLQLLCENHNTILQVMCMCMTV